MVWVRDNVMALAAASLEMKMPKDKSGTNYTGPTPKPATPGTKVTIHTPKGPKPGVMGGGGYVISDKKK
jgi:hypothetical protein